jgi:hypothetical protein
VELSYAAALFVRKERKMAEEELISKRELLRAARISYGTLYRWKRMNLIPESWFIHKATRTGQETYFPKKRILTRVGRIQELKGEVSSEQLKEIFSSNVKSFRIPLDDFQSLELVSKLSFTAFTSVFPLKKELVFDDVFAVYVVDHLMRLSGIYLEDAKQVLRMLDRYLSTRKSKEFQLILLRKMGIPFTVLVKGGEEILLEDNTEIIACADLAEFEEALKDQLIA